MQFANPYYLETKSAAIGENGRIITIVMTLVVITLMFAVGPFTVLYIYPIVVRIISKDKAKEESTNKLSKNFYRKLIHWVPLLCTGTMTCVSLFAIHIFSLVRFVQYADEVLSSETENRAMGIMYTVLSLLAVITGIVFSVTVLMRRISKSKKDGNKEIMVTAVVISVNIIYVGSYFLPYITWSFIHSPLLTIFTYLLGMMLIISVYLICLGVWRLCKFFFIKAGYKQSAKVTKLLSILLYCCMGWAVAFTFIIFLIVNTYVITLGKFEDFEELKSLAPSLLIAVFGLFLFKPAYKYVKGKLEDDKKDEDPAAPVNDNQNQLTSTVFITNL